MRRFKIAAAAILVLAIAVLAAGCSAEATPYETNNAEGFTVSVKYDANGGIFTTNTSVIVDSYNVADVDTDSEGNAQIALLPPDNEARGNDAFTAMNNGYFLAGWYAERTQAADGSYTYAKPWDFEADRLAVDPNGTYTSEEPVITLYAAWVPLFEMAFYSLDTGEYLESYSYDPTAESELLVPAWDEETGAIEMYDFPERSGYTYKAAYLDAAGTQPIDGDAVVHPGVVDPATGTAQNVVLDVYIDWTEGEWFHIYNAEQFLENASVNGNYEIHADLDFEGEIWPTSLMYGNFGGEIRGNGHTLKNITFTQTNNSKVNAGLFGHLTETATISDVTFENVSFTIEAGTRVVGTSYGLLAGTLSGEATLENVKIVSSVLQIDTSCYFGVDDYVIGLVCGMGDASAVPTAEITCAVVGEDPDSMTVTVSGNAVTVDMAEE